MRVTYYASRISENIGRMPETGYLLCRDAVIARTGYQRYSVRELPQDQAEALGIDISDWSKYIDLYRPSEEVFSPSTIASFEGQSVCDEHPPEFVDADNFRDYTRGHAQNIRRGTEPLDQGDYPLIADLIIADADLISKVEGGLRELSCGYSYTLKRDGNRFIQADIVGNHIAVVAKGRAGPEARIYDSRERWRVTER